MCRAHRRALAGAIRRLEGRHEEIGRAILDACREEVAFYGAIEDSQMLAGLRIALTGHARGMLAAFSSGRMRERDIPSLAAFARLRVEQGIPLHAVLQGWHVGTRVALGYILTELRAACADVAGYDLLTRDVITVVEQGSGKVVAAIIEVYHAAQRAAEHERGREDALADLLDQHHGGDVAARAAVSLGYAPGPSNVCAVVALGEGHGDLLRREFRGSVVGVRGPVLVVVVPVEDADTNAPIAATLREVLARAPLIALRACAGIGLVHPGVTGIAESYTEACEALDLLRSLDERCLVLRYELALRYALLRKDPALTAKIVSATLGPLLAHDQSADPTKRLIPVVEAYLECEGSRNATAKRLHMHAKTLDARLLRIRQLAPVSLAEERDLFALGLLAARAHPRG